MGAFVLDQGVKPAQWPLTPALVDPKWGWIHKHATRLLPFWGGGGVPRDYSSNKATITQSGTAASWGAGVRGSVFDFTGVTTKLDLGNAVDVLPSTDRGTFLFVRRLTDQLLRNATSFGSENIAIDDRVACFLPWSSGGGTYFFDWGNPNVDGRAEKTGIGKDSGPVETIAFVAGPAGLRGFQNGIVIASNTVAAMRSHGTTEHFFINGGIDDGDLQEVLFFAVLDYEATDQEIAQWHDDPFGSIRMLDEVGAVILPVSGEETQQGATHISLVI